MTKSVLIMSTFVSLLMGLLLNSTLVGAPVDGDLPPRPPTVTPIPKKHPQTGGWIILRVQATAPIPAGLWTMVQWQDTQGGWHDVEGWQGAFNDRMEVVWWVAPKDLNTGPFRWVVYEAQGSREVIGVSESFDLPANNRETVTVEVTLR